MRALRASTGEEPEGRAEGRRGVRAQRPFGSGRAGAEGPLPEERSARPRVPPGRARGGAAMGTGCDVFVDAGGAPRSGRVSVRASERASTEARGVTCNTIAAGAARNSSAGESLAAVGAKRGVVRAKHRRDQVRETAEGVRVVRSIRRAVVPAKRLRSPNSCREQVFLPNSLRSGSSNMMLDALDGPASHPPADPAGRGRRPRKVRLGRERASFGSRDSRVTDDVVARRDDAIQIERPDRRSEGRPLTTGAALHPSHTTSVQSPDRPSAASLEAKAFRGSSSGVLARRFV